MSTSTITRRKKKAPAVMPRKKAARKPAGRKDLAAGYNTFKEFEGRQYSGMQVGRSHTWHYDKGEWKETKITPDLWEISYAVTKRRAGHAPEGSGVPVGTGYHWYIMAHQNVTKLNANDYSTSMTGVKYKLSHKRANKEKWSATLKTQRKHLVAFLKEMIGQLEQPEVPIDIEYKGKTYTGDALPLPSSCENGLCDQWDVTLNDEHLGLLYRTSKGWKMKSLKDQKLVNALGAAIIPPVI